MFSEAPEEQYDPRCLFERLEANRVKKQEEFDEAHKMSRYFTSADDYFVTFFHAKFC